MSGHCDSRECDDALEGRERVEAALDDERAETARLRAALESIQWGSCDGCGNHYRCPECHGYRPLDDPGDASEGMTYGHKPDCKVAAALGAGKPQSEAPHAFAVRCSHCEELAEDIPGSATCLRLEGQPHLGCSGTWERRS